MTDTSPLRNERIQSPAGPQRTGTRALDGGADQTYRSPVNPSRPAGRYRLFDRNNDPAHTLPAIPVPVAVNLPRNPYRKEGS
ncbi:hypothetical protein Misp05_43220 [Micromonospora sp. NBRC 107095]|nr:hypothetical protein Misp05_43220 [Micromonospora sp. NBRC 107095]